MTTNTDLKEFKKKIRNILADYIRSEGCDCCSNTDKHKEDKEKLAKLLNIPAYYDNSGYNFSKFESKVKKNGN